MHNRDIAKPALKQIRSTKGAPIVLPDLARDF
jgi:hypothetical protein